MIIKKELIKREIAGETILVPVGKAVLESNGLFMLNELGTFIWDLLPGANSEEDICNAVVEQYDVAVEIAQKDVSAFLEKIRSLGII